MNRYNWNEIDRVLEEIGDVKFYHMIKHKQNVAYGNIACSFSFDTTSFKLGNKKIGLVYFWSMGIDDSIIIGRTLEQFKSTIEAIQKHYELDDNKRLVFYAPVLDFEFQFIKKFFAWDSVFASDVHSPFYAVTGGIEMRCYQKLADARLDDIGKKLTKSQIIRHEETPLSEEEIAECLNAVTYINNDIKKRIENDGGVKNIPLTKTSYVRRDVKKAVMNDRKSRELVRMLRMSKKEYNLFKLAFRGGDVGANANMLNMTQKEADGFDMCSSFSAVMCSEMFPMSNGEKVKPKDKNEFLNYCANYCCIFGIELINLKLKENVYYAPLLANSQIKYGEDTILSKGRVVESNSVKMSMTNADFEYYKRFYDFDYRIGSMYIYERAYLPRPIIECILEYYEKKNTLKGIKNMEWLYAWAKSNLNSIYGMMVMNIIHEIITYNGEWGKKEGASLESSLEKYNKDKGRFNWYPWGVFITAYARRNLLTGIFACGKDFIYSDTDSLKILNVNEHIGYIKKYNMLISQKIDKCLNHYGLDVNKAKAGGHQLGAWEHEGHYSRFKTLGPKKYISEEDGEIETTIAGLSKKAGAEFFSMQEDPFEAFNIKTKIDAAHSQKMGYYYVEKENEINIVDYLGNEKMCYIKSGIYLEPVAYDMNSDDLGTVLSKLLGFERDFGFLQNK